MEPPDVVSLPPVRTRTRAFGSAKPQPVRAKIVIEWERCKGCGFCVSFCPTDALKLSEEFNKKGYHPPIAFEEKCLDCGFCELVCPEFSIYSIVVLDDPTTASPKPTRAA